MEAEKKAFKITKREIGFVLGIVVFLLVKFLPLAELSSTVELTVGGQTCLALTLATVVFWACGVAQPGFVGLLYCALLVLFKVCVDDTGAASISATVASTFSSWTKATMWLVIGAYLIASAVKESGLGERIAYAFMLKFVRDAKSLIISIFALTFVLSLLIPHPFPRPSSSSPSSRSLPSPPATVTTTRASSASSCLPLPPRVPSFFLTGDSTLNPLVAQYSAEAGGMSPSFVDWFLYMSVPMLVALLCTLFLGLFLFKPSKELVYDREQIVAKQAALGKLSVKEIRTIVWLVIAIALWLTVSGDYIGWVTLAIGVALAMPIIGEVLTPASWNAVDIKSLMFLTAAMAVGSVGGATGMNAWIADVVLPSSVPENIFLFALLVAALSMIIHMFMGSVMAVLGVCVPAFISFAAGSSVSPLAVALIVFTSINIHYILPFHNLPILIGEGKDAGGYTSKEAMRMGIPLTAVVFVVVLVEAAWFHLFGLM